MIYDGKIEYIADGVSRQRLVNGATVTVYDDFSFVPPSVMNAPRGVMYVRSIPSLYGNPYDASRPNGVRQTGIGILSSNPHLTVVNPPEPQCPWCLAIGLWLAANLMTLVYCAVVVVVAYLVVEGIHALVTVPDAQLLSTSDNGVQLWQSPGGDMFRFFPDGRIENDIPYNAPIPDWVWYAAGGLAIAGVAGVAYMKYKDTDAGKAVRSMASSAGKLASRGMTAVAKKAEEVVT